MKWWEYVTRTAGTESPKAMSQVTGIDSPSFSKWKGGQVPKAETVAAFARAYGRPVSEAFVAAGFMTAAEAKVRPVAAPSYDDLTDDELLRILRDRLRGISPALRTNLPSRPVAIAAHEEEYSIESEQEADQDA